MDDNDQNKTNPTPKILIPKSQKIEDIKKQAADEPPPPKPQQVILTTSSKNMESIKKKASQTVVQPAKKPPLIPEIQIFPPPVNEVQPQIIVSKQKSGEDIKKQAEATKITSPSQTMPKNINQHYRYKEIEKELERKIRYEGYEPLSTLPEEYIPLSELPVHFEVLEILKQSHPEVFDEYKEKTYDNALDDPEISNLSRIIRNDTDIRFELIKKGYEGKDLQKEASENEESTYLKVLEEESGKLWKQFVKNYPDKARAYANVQGINKVLQQINNSVPAIITTPRKDMEAIKKLAEETKLAPNEVKQMEKTEDEVLKVTNIPTQKQNTPPQTPNFMLEKYFKDKTKEKLDELKKSKQKTTGEYGSKISDTGHSNIYLKDRKASVFFKDPNDINSLYEAEFARKYGDGVVMPKFISMVNGGYQYEALKGTTLDKKLEDHTLLGKKERKKNRVLTNEQAQQLLNQLAQYHKTTGQVFNFDLDNILVTSGGYVQLGGSGYEASSGKVSPKREMTYAKKLLESNFGVKVKSVPTISARKATKTRKAFRKEVESSVTIKDKRFWRKNQTKIEGFKDPSRNNWLNPNEILDSEEYAISDDVLEYQAKTKALEDLQNTDPVNAQRYKKIATNIFSLSENENVIKPGQSYQGNMPILEGSFLNRLDEQDHYKFKTLYGRQIKDRTHKEVFRDEVRDTIFFKDPKSIKSVYELEFMRKHGGHAGLSNFTGVVANGYQLEKTEGKTLAELKLEINTKFDNLPKNKTNDKKHLEELRKALTPKQAQELLKLLAEYHKTTGQTHGLNEKDIVISPNGEVKLNLTQYRDPKDKGFMDPKKEIKKARQMLLNEYGLDTKRIKTISRRKAISITKQFEREVNNKLVFEKKRFGRIDRSRITGFKEPSVQIQLNRSDDLFGRFTYTEAPSVSSGETYTPPQPRAVSPIWKTAPADMPAPRFGKRISSSIGNVAKGIGKGVGQLAKGALKTVGNVMKKMTVEGLKLIGKVLAQIIAAIAPILLQIAAVIALIGLLVIMMLAYFIMFVIYVFVWMIIVILFSVFVLFIINTGAYIVPPGSPLDSSSGTVSPVSPFPGISESEYIAVEKRASIEEFPNSELPETVTYLITIRAKDNDLINIDFTYGCNVLPAPASCPSVEDIYVTGNPNPLPNFDAAIPDTISANDIFQISYSQTFTSPTFNDKLVFDYFSVEADAVGGTRTTATGALNVKIGDPPVTSCPIPDGVYLARRGSYDGTQEIGHGSNSYWGNLGVTCNYPIPVIAACYGPTSLVDPDENNVCFGNVSGVCNEYGYALDVGNIPYTSVFFPNIFGQQLTWNLVRSGSIDNNGVEAAWGYFYVYSSGNYQLWFGHMNSGAATTGVSGGFAGNLYPIEPDSGHLHIELQLNGQWVKPDFLCGGPGP